VRVIDEVFGNPQTVGEVLLFLPAAGGSTQASIEWPMPADAQFTPDFNNKITLIVDPDNEVAERNEKNNTVTVTGTCLG
jgi:subtilase family serine protease